MFSGCNNGSDQLGKRCTDSHYGQPDQRFRHAEEIGDCFCRTDNSLSSCDDQHDTREDKDCAFAERNIRVIAGILLRVIFCALYQQEHIGEEGDQKDKTFKPADRSDRLTVRSMQDQTAAEKQNQHGHNYREGEIPLYDLRCDRYRGKDRAGSQNTEQVEKI